MQWEFFSGLYNIRRDNQEVQNNNFLPLIYTLEIELNLLDFDPRYPKNSQTLGGKLRKARMDKGMTVKEVATLFGVSETAVINWKIIGKMPQGNRMEMVKEFIEGKLNNVLYKN